MRRLTAVLIAGFMLIATLSYAGNGDLIVDGKLGVGTINLDERLNVNGNIKLSNFGYISGARQPSNNFGNLFLGGSIKDNFNGTYTVETDYGSNYFAAWTLEFRVLCNKKAALPKKVLDM